MQFRSLFTTLFFALRCSASPLDKRDTPSLDVRLQSLGNTTIVACVTNTGPNSLNLHKPASIFDSNPTRKVQLLQNGTSVQFIGIYPKAVLTDLDPSDFVSIGPNQTLHTNIDIGDTHNLGEGGSFQAVARSSIAYAKSGSTEIAGRIPYHSNAITVSLSAATATSASSRRRSNLKVRGTGTNVQPDCNAQMAGAKDGLSQCAAMANAAASAAANGDAKMFQDYFKTTDKSVRSQVQARLSAIARECSSTNSGKTRMWCTDPTHLNWCQPTYYAVTDANNNEIELCPKFFNLPTVANTCFAADKATTLIHESTHAPGIYPPSTDDIAYYAQIFGLSATQALNNADNFTLYAQAVYLKKSCAP